MKDKLFTKEQIISILKEHEVGAKVQGPVRNHSVYEQGIYRWKSRYVGRNAGNWFDLVYPCPCKY